MKTVMGKDAWVALFTEVGITKAQMQQWHELFENQYPEFHQSFLEWLGLSVEEIEKVRS